MHLFSHNARTVEFDHMKPLSDYDDFLRVEDTINILVKNTGVGNYDFGFCQHFDCKSIIDKQDEPVLLRIGAIQDFDEVKNELESVGCSLTIFKGIFYRGL